MASKDKTTAPSDVSRESHPSTSETLPSTSRRERVDTSPNVAVISNSRGIGYFTPETAPQQLGVIGNGFDPVGLGTSRYAQAHGKVITLQEQMQIPASVHMQQPMNTLNTSMSPPMHQTMQSQYTRVSGMAQQGMHSIPHHMPPQMNVQRMQQVPHTAGSSYQKYVNVNQVQSGRNPVDMPNCNGPLVHPNNVQASPDSIVATRYGSAPPGRYLLGDNACITCKPCGLRFKNPTTCEQNECRLHDVEEPETRSAKVVCALCKSESKNKQNLKRHISVVHGDKDAPDGCPSSCAAFSSTGSSKIHMKNADDIADNFAHLSLRKSATPYGRVSSKRATPYGRVGSKRAIIKKVKAYTCPLCPDTFKWKGNLKRHRMLVHEKLKSFTCRICKAKFGSKSNMTAHLITHEKLRGTPGC